VLAILIGLTWFISLMLPAGGKEVGLVAQAAEIVLLVLYGFIVGLFVAVRGAFASREKLLELAPLIGTKSPTVARVVCWVTLLILVGVPVAILVALAR